MNLKSAIETVLFAYGEPMSSEKLAKLTGAKKEEAMDAINDLKTDYEGRGFVILEKDGTYELGSNPEHAGVIEKLMKSEFSEELTRAAVETLAIVAYKGPLTRAEIEYLRGVNSSFILRNLLMRGLVERIENPKDARSYLYRISFDFLKYMGVSKIEDLQGYEEFRKTSIGIEGEAKPDT